MSLNEKEKPKDNILILFLIKLTPWTYIFLTGVIIGYFLPSFTEIYQYTGNVVFITSGIALILLLIIHIGIRIQIIIKGEDMMWNSYYPNQWLAQIMLEDYKSFGNIAGIISLTLGFLSNIVFI